MRSTTWSSPAGELARRTSPFCSQSSTTDDADIGSNTRHDDITYDSIAKAFGLKLRLHQDTLNRMKAKSKSGVPEADFSWENPSPAMTAKLRMAELPFDEDNAENNEVLFVDEDLWVPISVVNGNVYILPGVPRLFTQLLEGLRPILLSRLQDPEGKGLHRIMFSTPLGESAIATYLTELAERVKPRGVKVGSYPRMPKCRNTVTLVGKDREYMEGLVDEVETGVQGRRIDVEGEDDSDKEQPE